MPEIEAKGLRILVTGDRKWSNRKIIQDAIESYNPALVIEGGANGADRIASQVCYDLGIANITVPADWERYGRAAGPIRNRLMLTEYKPDLVLAFHDYIANSKGTKNMIHTAMKARIIVRLYTQKDPIGSHIDGC